MLNRGEAVNALKHAIYTGRVSPAQAKRPDEMQAVADALSLLATIVMAWNKAQMQGVLNRWANRRQVIPSELIGRIAPTRLEGITKRGDTYLRTLLIQGAKSAVMTSHQRTDKISQWAVALRERSGWQKAVVALAN